MARNKTSKKGKGSAGFNRKNSDDFLKKNYPGEEQIIFDKLSKYQPIGRMGKPEEIAKLALFLCSEESSFITGVAYDIDGGVMNLR